VAAERLLMRGVVDYDEYVKLYIQNTLSVFHYFWTITNTKEPGERLGLCF